MIVINGVEKEDLALWRDNHVTKKVMEAVHNAREEFAHATLSGQFIGDELGYARAVSAMWAFDQLLNIEHEEEDQK